MSLKLLHVGIAFTITRQVWHPDGCTITCNRACKQQCSQVLWRPRVFIHEKAGEFGIFDAPVLIPVQLPHQPVHVHFQAKHLPTRAQGRIMLALSFASANTLALPRSRFNCPCINRTQESSALRHMMRTSPNHSHQLVLKPASDQDLAHGFRLPL